MAPHALSLAAPALPNGRWQLPAGAGPVLAVVAMLGGVLALGVGSGAIGWNRDELNPALVALAAFAAIGTASRRFATRPAFEQAGAAVQQLSTFVAIAILSALTAALFATSARPYADAWLAAADRAILPGFNWPATMVALERAPALLTVLTHAYGALQWEPLLLITLFCARGQDAAGWRLLAGWSIALLACVAAFPWFPAQGAYPFFGIAAERVPDVGVPIAWRVLPLIEGLRDGSIAVLDNMAIDGIITMPSFHAAGAVVLARAGWRAGGLRWPLTALNVAMIASAMPIGGHYLIDVLAGAAVGIGATGAARRISRS